MLFARLSCVGLKAFVYELHIISFYTNEVCSNPSVCRIQCNVIPHTLSYKQDRQCTYNVTLMRIRATKVAVEKQ